MTATAILAPVQTKTCTKCGEVKTIENFHARSGASDGRASACKVCIEAYKKARRLIDNAEWHQKKADASKMQESGTRKCTCCKDVFPLTSDFYSTRNDRSPAFSSRCRPCEAIKSKENRLERNPRQKAVVEKRQQLKEAGLRECSVCKETYPATTEFFYTDKGSLRGACKPCEKAREAESRINCKDKKAEYNKMYVLKNKEIIHEKNKEWRKNNRETLIPKMRAWYKNNQQRVIDGNSRRSKERRESDPVFAMECRVRSFVGYAFRLTGYTKRSRTHEILGCDWEFFKTHIEKQFTKGMTWENRSEWHIDHITPLATAKTEAEVIALNHFTNLRPLWAKDNLAKSDSIQYLI